MPLSAWPALLPQAVWPGPSLSPPPQVGIPLALSTRGPAGLSMALSDLVEKFIPQSRQQLCRPPWGRQGSAKGPLRARYQQALNGATGTCPRLTGEAQPDACDRTAVSLLSGSGVQRGSGGQRSQPVVSSSTSCHTQGAGREAEVTEATV